MIKQLEQEVFPEMISVDKCRVDATNAVVSAGLNDPNGEEDADADTFKSVFTSDAQRGYQRDPHARASRLDKQGGGGFKPMLAGAIVTSLRDDGFHYIIDGAGRWLKAQKAGRREIMGFVYRGLSRKQEAELFVKLAVERSGLTAVDKFLAELKAKNPNAVAIAAALTPYRVGRPATLNIQSVGALHCLLHYKNGEKLMADTASILKDTWGSQELRVKGNEFMAVAQFIDVAKNTGRYDAGLLKRTLGKLTPNTLSRQGIDSAVKVGGSKPHTAEKAKWMAVELATIYNRGKPDNKKILKEDLVMGELAEAFSQRKAIYD